MIRLRHILINEHVPPQICCPHLSKALVAFLRTKSLFLVIHLFPEPHIHTLWLTEEPHPQKESAFPVPFKRSPEVYLFRWGYVTHWNWKKVFLLYLYICPVLIPAISFFPDVLWDAFLLDTVVKSGEFPVRLNQSDGTRDYCAWNSQEFLKYSTTMPCKWHQIFEK